MTGFDVSALSGIVVTLLDEGNLTMTMTGFDLLNVFNASTPVKGTGMYQYTPVTSSTGGKGVGLYQD
jgi:hypothetical protein